MIWAIGFYWFCAGLAAMQLQYEPGLHFLIRLSLSLIFGGVFIPVRILQKLAA